MTNLIVKDNILIQASHRLGEAEQRLILLAILQARQNSQTIEELTGKELSIHADDYIDSFGGTRQNAYINLRKAVMGLFDAKWGYKHHNKNGNLVVAHERFTQSAKYIESEATVKFMFANAIIPFLMELQKKFTQYDIKQVANLSSAYALRLYEYFLSFLHKNANTAYCEVSLDDLRFTLGLLQNEYKTMSNFKAYVLDFSIKQINENTDISVTYTQNKKGRTIVGFKFDLKRKKQKSLSKNTDADIDALFVGLTSPEIDAIKEAVQKTIENKGITDPKHIYNLYKKAVKEGWGLDKDCPPPAPAPAPKDDGEKRQKALQQQAEFDGLVVLYENGTADFKSAVDAQVRDRLAKTRQVFLSYFDSQLLHNQPYYNSRHLRDDFIFVMKQMEQ